MMKLQFGHLQE